MGQDIAGACGQLVVATEAKMKAASCSDGGKCSPGSQSVTSSVAQFDIEDLGSRSSVKQGTIAPAGGAAVPMSSQAMKPQTSLPPTSVAPGSGDPLSRWPHPFELISWGCIAVGVAGLLWRLKTRL